MAITTIITLVIVAINQLSYLGGPHYGDFAIGSVVNLLGQVRGSCHPSLLIWHQWKLTHFLGCAAKQTTHDKHPLKESEIYVEMYM